MQMIEAVIKPHKLDAVKTALAKLNILGVTAMECKGFGRQMGHTERYRGTRMDVGFVPKVLLKIFVYPIAQVVRIRTGERDEQAL
jgi:nitrogen regulatory protein PII